MTVYSKYFNKPLSRLNSVSYQPILPLSHLKILTVICGRPLIGRETLFYFWFKKQILMAEGRELIGESEPVGSNDKNVGKRWTKDLP